MFSYFKSSHKKYAGEIEKSKTMDDQKKIAVEYFKRVSKKNKTLDDKLMLLKSVLKPKYHKILADAYSQVLNEFKEETHDKLIAVASAYEIPEEYIRDLAQHLANREICFVIDDSGTMAARDAHDNKGQVCSRWEALAQRIEISAAIAACLDPDGINLYFLNTTPATVRNLRSVKEIRNEFEKRKPTGYTPLRDAIERALSDGEDKPTLIEIATDGAPTDIAPPGYIYKPENLIMTSEGPAYLYPEAFDRLEKVLITRTPEGADKPPKNQVNFGVMLCTTGAEVEWWNSVDTRVEGLDVNRCFEEEDKEVFKNTGKHLSFGMYQAKILLGPFLSKYDQLDENNLNLKMRH